VLIPVYEDWEAAASLLARLDGALSGAGWRGDVLLVDDGSVARPDRRLVPPSPKALTRVRVLVLRRNLGHQRAIAVGLAFQEQEAGGVELPVLVMDGDGEDDPADALTLLRRFVDEGGRQAVFAGRARRSEGLAFRAGYRLFKLIHLLLIGHRVRVGNFSVLPASAVRQLVIASELWNHYAAAVHKLRIPYVIVPVDRSARLAGASRMSWVGLVVHGLSAISVFGEMVGVRLLVATGVLGLVAACGLALAVALPDVRNGPLGAWLPLLLVFGLAVLLQVAITATAFLFLLLSSRGNATFLPLRDHAFLHTGVLELHPAEASQALGAQADPGRGGGR
jgi:hypothetical protein